MADWPIYIWILLAVVVIVIIVIIVMVARKQSAVQNRERAAELRERAGNNEQLIDSRQDRAKELEREADEARHKALTASEQADALRVQAGESDELAARATEQAEILDDEATHSRESYEEAVGERDNALREADRRDPDVHTDRHGNRIEDDTDDKTVAVDDTAEVTEGSTAVVARDDELVEADNAAAVIDEPTPAVIPEADVLDADDDYESDEFAEPDADYIDPVEHDRADHEHNSGLFSADTVPARADVDEHRVDDLPPVEDVEPIDSQYAAEPELATDADAPVAARRMEYSPAEDDLIEDTPLVDPYGNPVVTPESPSHQAWDDGEDDVPRDEQGRRLDPYGNPVPEDRNL
ncbi:hypothetical protein [Tessaracoccus antarcticus]|uniref:Uncharacterized protein n=1 Tax=Tessaracoccus antarcticus TaxID=2479848 RepID=A0A3M0G9X8_9ACTN|nr:hypothetical protein [Tessaracoccus antarcticus]RMB61750.1 hypothetical protein EAX62_03765 [Tessaracoccus antarcticus]